MPGRVLVAGAQGFLGREIVAALLADGADAVLGLGRSARNDAAFTHQLDWCGAPVAAPVPARIRNDDPRYSYVAADASDQAAVDGVVRDFHPDVVVHSAASLRDEGFDALLDSNLRATYALASAAAGARFVYVSSGSVYGAGRGVLPLAEDGPTEPIELYGATKRAAEDVARVSASEVVVARVFNLVGPGLQDRHLPAKLAALLAASARGLGPSTLRIGPLTTTRDFVDVRDAARAIALCCSTSVVPGTYNVASGIETPVRAVLDLLVERSGADVGIDWQVGRPADIPRAWADVSRLAASGFGCAYDLDATLRDMLDYFADFPDRRPEAVPQPPDSR